MITVTHHTPRVTRDTVAVTHNMTIVTTTRPPRVAPRSRLLTIQLTDRLPVVKVAMDTCRLCVFCVT